MGTCLKLGLALAWRSRGLRVWDVRTLNSESFGSLLLCGGVEASIRAWRAGDVRVRGSALHST